MTIEHHILIEIIRLIGEGNTWDALELLRRVADDDGLQHAVEMAQFQVEMPW